MDKEAYVKNWIERMSRIVGGLLFQGGYVVSPATLAGGRPSPAADDRGAERRVRGDACGRALAAGA